MVKYPLIKKERPNGVGAIERVTIRNCRFWATKDRYSGEPLIPMETNANGLRLENLTRDAVRDVFPGRPFARIRNVAPLSCAVDGRVASIADHGSLMLPETPRNVCFGIR